MTDEDATGEGVTCVGVTGEGVTGETGNVPGRKDLFHSGCQYLFTASVSGAVSAKVGTPSCLPVSSPPPLSFL